MTQTPDHSEDGTPEQGRTARRKLERWLRAQRPLAGPALRRAGMFGALAGCLVVPQAWLLAAAISPIVTEGGTLAQALPWLLPLVALYLLRFALAQGADRAAIRAGAAVKAAIRDRLLRHLQALGPSYVRRHASGALTTAALDGVEALEPYYTRYLPHMLSLAVVPALILVVVMPRDWISGVVLLVTGPTIPVFMILIGLGTEKLNQRQWRRLTQLGGRLLDALQRLTTLKMFNATEREAGVLAYVSEEYRRSTMKVLRVAFLSSLMLEFFATVGIALVAVLIGFRLLYGHMGFEAGFFALLLAPEFYAPLRQLGADYHARMEAIGASERLVAILETEPPANGTARPALPARIEIACDDVSFAYPQGRTALDGASLTLEAGAVTALVGPSGAGKSTLLALLLGLERPQGGRILIAGHDLATMDSEHWLAHVALVPQRPHMFAGTVRDNIALALPEAPLERVRDAARLAEADDFIMALPEGYDTPLGEHGLTLSGGQAQRIALARAFLKDAPVVLMDEATTGLDAASEALVTRAVARLAEHRTVLVIAHRLRTVRLARRIAVMEAGRIVEHGTHEALAAGDTRYAALLASAGLAEAEVAETGVAETGVAETGVAETGVVSSGTEAGHE
ncbi:thiol reductant ABC exporter subunit CydD [Ancylobacter sp. A5.8]|uniref:thiol reductant ABC exporter subunit CydD n=1 Tax=Ancylobacter gelatini TaxID=2919920 RepID=UPI001F4E24E0|nr:thiol reductant ABC exporter subunit CydD [Ancylobacter gelatini]MCJ8144344.1 thiol reductant ABC exporter subunit CydD [Ancylobacter gelatini]